MGHRRGGKNRTRGSCSTSGLARAMQAENARFGVALVGGKTEICVFEYSVLSLHGGAVQKSKELEIRA